MSPKKPSIANAPKRRGRPPKNHPAPVVATEKPAADEEVTISDIKDALYHIADQLGGLTIKANATAPAGGDDFLALLTRLEKLESNPPRLLGRVETLETISQKLNTNVTHVFSLFSRVDALEARLVPLEKLAANPTITVPAGTRIDVPQSDAPLIHIPNGAEAPKAKRGRPSKADIAAREAAAAQAPVEGVVMKQNDVVDQGAPVAEEPAPKPVANGIDVDESAVQARVLAGAKASDLIREFRISFNRANTYVEAFKPGPVVGNPPPAAQQTVEVKKAYVEPNPCKGCGMNLNDPADKHSAGCPIENARLGVKTSAASAPPPAATAAPAAQPAPVTAAPSPTLDDVRAVAITFAGKHGKEKLSEVLKKFGADKLSSVPEEQRGELMKALANGS